MSFARNKLKLAREALGKKDYETARDAANQVLEYEPENYNATVFLALASLELGDLATSEQAYRKAIDANPTGILAWQGISKFYERTGHREKFLDALKHVADIHAQSNDANKCAETLHRYIEGWREFGSRKQVVEALCLLLPDSSYFPVLSNLPAPDLTNPAATTLFSMQSAVHNSLPSLEEIVDLTERDEVESVKSQVENRRQRLDETRGPDQLRKAVEFEILGASQLPRFYNEIMNHPNTSDDLRRATESKLLRHKERYLYAIPASGESVPLKTQVASELESLVDGMVLLGVPDPLAWNLFINAKDCKTIEGYDFSTLRAFQELFPTFPLTALVTGYFAYSGVDAESSEEKQNKTNNAELDVDAAMDMMLDAFPALHDSILAHRILADVYLNEIDYPNAIKTAEVGLQLVSKAEVNSGKKLPLVRKAFKVVLSTSLVHFFPPKHHPRALRIIDEVLSQDSRNVACLMARGYIHEAAAQWTESCECFTRVIGLLPDDVDDGLRAQEEQAWCQVQIGDDEQGVDGLRSVLQSLGNLEDRKQDQARCLWRLGKCHWELGGAKREEAYSYFIQSLKHNPEYAPTFTSLGIFYLEFADPPDPTRATKCFQKAFELDPREAEAARRLAEGFAEEREWDLVEVVARRTIDGEGGAEAGVKPNEVAPNERYLPTNAWAWKAIGVVELIHKNYQDAIRALQVALRADPDDQLSWLRLGEAYGKAGRHAAAMKALGRARELMPNDWMSLYLIGEVQHQLGQYQDAISSFASILVHRPSEVGVLMSLAQSHLELGRVEMSSGFTLRSEQSFVACIRTSLEAIDASPGFRAIAWKIAADAIYDLSDCPSFKLGGCSLPQLSTIASILSVELSDRLSGVISSSALKNSAAFDEIRVSAVAVAAYDYNLSLTSPESPSVGAAWYDLGIALRAWGIKSKSPAADHQAIRCLKAALRQDPGNTLYWNALGALSFEEPKLAQHSYIKALDIDSKDVVTWTNIGLLYLHHGDLDLANQAFYRAQTLDPDYQVAWVGQALVATAHGDNAEAEALFEHAVDLPATVLEVDLELGSRLFARTKNNRDQRLDSRESLLPAFFVLGRYCGRRPNDVPALQLFGLICERISQVELGIEHTRRAIALLEAAYEESEDPVIERQFTIATSNLARMSLCVQDYEAALEGFGSVLGLLPENDPENNENSLTTMVIRAQAHLGSGLANFHLGNLDDALIGFEAAFEAARDHRVIKGQIVVLLAQTLWAIDTEESRESAKSRLLESITDDPENLAAVNALAGMGIVTDDDTLVDAALSEILSLPLDQRHELDPSGDVDYLLMHHRLGMSDTAQALSVAQKAVHAEPTRTELRRDLASLLIQQEEFQPAVAIFADSASHNNLDALRELGSHRAIAECLASSMGERSVCALRQAQRVVKLSPFQKRSWQTLAFVRGHRSE